MKKRITRSIAALGLIAGLTLAVTAQASPTYTYTATSTTSTGAAVFTSSPSGDPVSVTSATGAYVNGSSATSKWTVNSVVGASTGSSALVLYTPGGGLNYGLGMSSDGNAAPNHALDNNGNVEGVLLNFSASVALTNINLGYVSNGSASNTPNAIVGVSLFRWTGSNPPPSLNGETATTAGMGSWQLVGNYADGYGGNASDAIGESSSWWLVSAYDANFGTAQETNSTAATLAGTVSDSYFKLFSVSASAATTSKTPEPGSMALAGIALVGAAWTRRRSRKA